MNILTKALHHPQRTLIALAFIAFVALGLPDGLIGVGWPSIRTGFGIPLDAIGMLLVAGVTGYTTSSFLSGYLLARIGVGRLLAVSCLLTGAALIGYTIVPQWWMMVALGVIAGLGAGGIDAGLNTYVAAHFGEGLMQWLHASWGVGTTTGPVIMTFALTALSSWQFGYRVVGTFQLALATCFVLTLGVWERVSAPAEGKTEKKLTDHTTPIAATLRRPQAWLSMALFFVYVGAEGGLGIWAYTLLTESRGVDTTLAGFFAGSYWLTFTIGRFAAGVVASRLGVDRLVFGGLTGALLGTVLLMANASATSDLVAVCLIGVAIAPIFPAMMSGTRTRVGDHHAANTIGMQMAATGMGATAIPSLMGVLARRISLEIIPLFLLVLYAGLLAVYLLATKPGRIQASTGSTP